MDQTKRLAVYDLVGVPTRTIAVIVRRWDSRFCPSIVQGMQDVAGERGFEVVITDSEKWLNHRADGLVFIDPEMPGVLIGRPGKRRRREVVTIDHHRCGYLAAEHLILQGCERIALIRPASNSDVALQRSLGFREALTNYGRPVLEELYITDWAETEFGAAEVMQEVLRMDPRPDGLFITDDRAAIHCMNALRWAGVGVPEDIAIIGLNNDPAGRLTTPTLSTIQYPGFEIGREAACRLLDRLCGRVGSGGRGGSDGRGGADGRGVSGGRGSGDGHWAAAERVEAIGQPELIVRKSSLK